MIIELRDSLPSEAESARQNVPVYVAKKILSRSLQPLQLVKTRIAVKFVAVAISGYVFCAISFLLLNRALAGEIGMVPAERSIVKGSFSTRRWVFELTVALLSKVISCRGLTPARWSSPTDRCLQSETSSRFSHNSRPTLPRERRQSHLRCH
jgi:hypothetical protein